MNTISARQPSHCEYRSLPVVAGPAEGGGASDAGKPAAVLLTRAARHGWKPATLGACLGLLGAYWRKGRKPAQTALLVSSMLGAALGLSAGMAWQTRNRAGEMVRAARKNIEAARDARWLARHPIDYA